VLFVLWTMCTDSCTDVKLMQPKKLPTTTRNRWLISLFSITPCLDAPAVCRGGVASSSTLVYKVTHAPEDEAMFFPEYRRPRPW
jgi:hypothetical protein